MINTVSKDLIKSVTNILAQKNIEVDQEAHQIQDGVYNFATTKSQPFMVVTNKHLTFGEINNLAKEYCYSEVILYTEIAGKPMLTSFNMKAA